MWDSPVFEEAAHPRVSGENLVVLVTWQVVRGSSPRERGKPATVA